MSREWGSVLEWVGNGVAQAHGVVLLNKYIPANPTWE